MLKTAARQMKSWVCLSVILPALVLLIGVLGPVNDGCAQDFLVEHSDPNPVAPQPVELGYVESANGVLHLEIPLGSFPQRGTNKPLTYRLVYDSNLWQIFTGISKWWVIDNPASLFKTGGWYVAPTSFYVDNARTWHSCGWTYSDFNWQDSAKVMHFFPITTYDASCGLDHADGFATDSSGYHMYVTKGNNADIYAPDGTFLQQRAYGSDYTFLGVEDSNGNYIPPGSDTLGRSDVPPSTGCPSGRTCYDVLNSQGGTSQFSVIYTNIPVATNFGQWPVTECNDGCVVRQVIQSIALPDNSTYNFQYDCDLSTANPACGSPAGQSGYYGTLISMTLPTGGQINYGYTTFFDPYGNASRWLNSRTAAGGTSTYTPQALSTCTSQQVNCSESVTVTKPNGDSTVTIFRLNNGAWPTEIRSYDSAGALLATVTNTFDFSNSCPLTNCPGSAYIRKISELTTVPMPGGAGATKQVKYGYDSPYIGNMNAIQEWGFQPGGNPVFAGVPDKATYMNYIWSGTNIVNKPWLTTMCNNSGTDPDCPGGGSKVAQTKITYDSYGTDGLKSITGVANHDDNKFGTGNTTRGNPTQIERWVSGNTFLLTQLFYDTTGQVIKELDPKLNPTTYSYADNFFNDTGANPPQPYTPSKPTNAYLTSVTVGSLTQMFGYYWGSGRKAFAKDPNGATNYAHYLDSMDRLTRNDFPIGWNLTSYISATQADTYVGISDSSPSPSCTGCRHTQYLFDTWGRKTSEKLVNSPGGAINVDTNYDLNGRIQSVSHPYISRSDPTYLFETVTYDGSDRQIQLNHPDNQYAQTAYGALVGMAGGLTTQLGTPATYGYGYPVISVDEAGKQRQQWVDAFGRIVEVDEPGTQGSPPSGATAGWGSGAVTGAEQYDGARAATPGTGKVTIYGSEQSVTIDPCSPPIAGTFPCPETIGDSGTVTVKVNVSGIVFSKSVVYGYSSTRQSVATALASAFTNDVNSPVGAIASGYVLTLTSRATGLTSNYPVLTDAVTNDPSNFTGPSFWGSAYSPTLVGGNDAQPAVYDSGTVWITVFGFRASVNYQQGSDTNSLAGAFLTAFLMPDSPVTASVTGSTLTLTAKHTGQDTNYWLSSGSSTSLPARFSWPSFTISGLGISLTGGTDAVPPVISNPNATLYTYDVLGNLTKVIQGAQTRTYLYDGLGRVTSRTTPEAGTDNFYYTASDGGLCAGDSSALCRKTDGRGITTTYNYDALNRFTGKTYAGGTPATPAVSYFYDEGGAAAFALGRPTRMVDGSGSETYSYDQIGRITQLTKVVGTTSFTTKYQFNVAGELTQTTYPSNRIVQQSYDSIGRLCEVAPQTTGCGTGTSTFAKNYGYNAGGQVTGFNYGNGVVASFKYSPDRLQLQCLQYSMAVPTDPCQKDSTALFNLKYFYTQPLGNNGQITGATDNVEAGRSVNYTYDVLGRLSTAVTDGSAGFPKWGLSWNYDRYGNRLSQNATAGSPRTNVLGFGDSTGARTNQPDGMCFDASGNLLVETSSVPCPPAFPTYTYDAENRLVNYGSSAVYAYDGNDLRVQKTVNGTNTVSVFSGSSVIAEYDNGAAAASPSREYIYSGGQLVATLSGTTTTYHHPDHLSVRLGTDASGNKIGEQGHYPYGEAWYTSGTTTKFIFTTYERDTESDNDYALARFYINRFGRFACVDPEEGNPGDPQSWNRYAYARNDPINITDPSGKGWFSWLLHGILGILDIATMGSSTPLHGLLVAHHAIKAVRILAFLISVGATAAEVTRFTQGSKASQPDAPKGYRPCPTVLFKITGVGPDQATGAGATGTPPSRGDVAFNPKNFGLSNKQGRKIADSDNPIIFKPDWEKGRIPGPHGRGTVRPAPGAGMPTVPEGLPVGTDDTLPGTDVIGGVNRSANVNRIDLYRYEKASDADRSLRIVPVKVYLPIGSGAHCPRSMPM